MEEWADRREHLAEDRTALAQFRTKLAEERTALAQMENVSGMDILKAAAAPKP